MQLVYSDPSAQVQRHLCCRHSKTCAWRAIRIRWRIAVKSPCLTSIAKSMIAFKSANRGVGIACMIESRRLSSTTVVPTVSLDSRLMKLSQLVLQSDSSSELEVDPKSEAESTMFLLLSWTKVSMSSKPWPRGFLRKMLRIAAIWFNASKKTESGAWSRHSSKGLYSWPSMLTASSAIGLVLWIDLKSFCKEAQVCGMVILLKSECNRRRLAGSCWLCGARRLRARSSQTARGRKIMRWNYATIQGTNWRNFEESRMVCGL